MSDIYLRENGRGELVEASRVNGELLVHFGPPKARWSFWCGDCPGDSRCLQAACPPSVPVAGIPTNLRAGTNKDAGLMLERSNMLVLGGTPRFRVFEEIASSTLTVRLSGWGEVAVLVRNPTGIAKVTGLTPPSGF